MKYSKRINIDGEYELGQIGFLIRTSPQQRADSYHLSMRPAAKNQSGERVIYGWCGSWNNTSTSGCGIAKVRRVYANGRVQVGVLTDRRGDGELCVSDEAHREELQKFLDDMGYSDEFDFSDAPAIAA